MDHAGVKAALARVMSRYTWFPALLQENDDAITRDTIVEKVEARAKCLNVPPGAVARHLLLSRLKTLAQDVVRGHTRSRELELLADTMGHLVERKVLTGTELEESLLQEPLLLSLPLTAIWRITRTRVISIEQVIKSMYESDTSKKASLVNDLLDLLLHQRGNSNNTQAASDILAILVDFMYSGSENISQEWQPLTKFAGEVLQSLTEEVLDVVLDASNLQCASHKQEVAQGTTKQPEDHQLSYSQKHKKQKLNNEEEMSTSHCEVTNMYLLVLENPRVPQDAVEGFFSAQLVQMLTHKPNIKLVRVLKDQKTWCSTQANPTLVALMQKLVVGLGYKETLNVLELVLSNQEVNWGCVLTLVATALTCHHATTNRLKELIERNIRQGCEELEIEPMVVGFLFARHAGQEGRHLFPSYVQWFSSLFSPETSPAPNKQSFVFLMKFLTEMVPHEPAYCLRAHLNAHIFTPKGCHEIFQSYTNVARARLQELKETMHDNTQVPSSKLKVMEEVKAAVKQFSETGKVPGSILGASILRESYFRSLFIPALLTPRHLPDVPDAQAKLIEALHVRGKISQNMMRNYTKACQKEASDLLQGVFVDLEEEEVLLEEPITELLAMLEELITTHQKHPHSNGNVMAAEVLPVLSKVSCKLEEMMKGLDSQLKNAGCLIFDRRLYDEKLLSTQIVEHILNTLQRLLPPAVDEERETQQGRPELLTQLLSLLSTGVTLQRSLLLLLFHHLYIENHTQEELKTDGIILCELSKIEGLFLPVVEATQPSHAPSPITAFYLHNLPLDDAAATHNICCILSSWLDWHLMHQDSAATLPPQPFHLYLCLAPRLPLLLNHSENNEATAADVHHYMGGNDVPECSRLFFDDNLKWKTIKIPLKTWLDFELRASWGNTPIEARQTFLHIRFLECVSLTQPGSSPPKAHTQTPDRLIAALVSSFATLGLKQRNSSDMLLLLQNMTQQYKSVGFCLLEAWHSDFKGGKIDSRSTMSYISICRCLSPSLFLKADKLLELAEILQTLVNVLMSVTDMIQLSLCDTTFLCASLFTAAAEPNVRNLHFELCLKPIKPAIVFHWDSLQMFFKSHSSLSKHECFKFMCITLSQGNPQLLLLGHEEAGIRLLALTLRLSEDRSNKRRNIITSFSGQTSSYLKWLLAYLGLQQVKGKIPYLTVQQGEKFNITEVDKTVMVWCFKELLKVLGSKTLAEVTGNLLPREDEVFLGFRLIPVACIFLLICVKEGHLNTNGDNLGDGEFLEIFLQSSNIICHTFDNQSGEKERQQASSSNSARRSLLSRKKWLPDLDYLSQLHQKLIMYLSAATPSVLASITKNTLMKCDGEVRATIYSRTAGKKM